MAGAIQDAPRKMMWMMAIDLAGGSSSDSGRLTPPSSPPRPVGQESTFHRSVRPRQRWGGGVWRVTGTRRHVTPRDLRRPVRTVLHPPPSEVGELYLSGEQLAREGDALGGLRKKAEAERVVALNQEFMADTARWKGCMEGGRHIIVVL